MFGRSVFPGGFHRSGGMPPAFGGRAEGMGGTERTKGADDVEKRLADGGVLAAGGADSVRRHQRALTAWASSAAATGCDRPVAPGI